MNPNLNLLHPYPFQKLRTLFSGITPDASYSAINLSIGEPKHATPPLITQALIDHLSGLANYPTTQGSIELRQSIADWLQNRYQLAALDIEREVLPVAGSREALFAFAQAIVDTSKHKPVVISPNPFYQIYEGAALLAGAEPYFVNTLTENNFRMDFSEVPIEIWRRTQLVYLCSPGNPTGKVMSLEDWREIFNLADQYGFVIAADECYSEIYFDEAPLGALQAAKLLERDYTNLVVFGSLSKRSNVPGMRSGFVAGDAKILEKFLLYRTYQGCALNPAVQAASAVAWRDEAHVIENRRLYNEKFSVITPLLQTCFEVTKPEAAFYLWVKSPTSDTEFAQKLYQAYNVTVLPGSYLAREAHGINPGAGFVRIALVANHDECLEAAKRITLAYT